MRDRKRSRPTIAGALIALLMGVVFLTLLSEAILRVAMPNWREYASAWFMVLNHTPGYADVTLGRPGFDGFFSQNNGDFRSHIRINDFGLRDDEPVTAANGRLWVIGDSMSFGWGVERDRIYTQVIGEHLAVDTYNVAGPGTNVCGWQTLYGRMPKEVVPAAVVVGLTIENRMAVYDCPAEVRDAEAAQHRPPPSTTMGELLDPMTTKMYLTAHSALYNFFAVSLKRVGAFERSLEAVGVVRKPQMLMHDQHSAEEAAKMVETTADALRDLRAMVPPEIPFLVVLFPARFEIRDGNAYFHDLRVAEAEALAARGIATLDLLPQFKQAGIEGTHFAHDGHWSEAGHRIAGEAIAGWFSDNGLFPRRTAEH